MFYFLTEAAVIVALCVAAALIVSGTLDLMRGSDDE